MANETETEKNTAAIEILIKALDMNSKATAAAGDTRRLGEKTDVKRNVFAAAANVIGGKAIKQVTEPMRQFFAPAKELLTDIRVAQGKLIDEEEDNQKSTEPQSVIEEDAPKVLPAEPEGDAPKVLPAEPEGDAQRIQSDEPKGAFTREGDNQEVVATKEGGEYLLLDIAANVETIANLMTKSSENQEAASREAVTDQNFEAEQAAEAATRLVPETGEPVEKGDDENDGPGFLDKLKEKLGTAMTAVTTSLGVMYRKQLGSVIKKMSSMLGKTISTLRKAISAPFKVLGTILKTILRFLGPIGVAIGVGAAAFSGAKALLENTETGKKIAGAASEGIGAVADFVKGETPETKEQAEIKEGIQSKTMDVNELTIQRIGANKNLTPEQKKAQVGLIQNYTMQQAQGDVDPQIQKAYHQVVETNAKSVPDITPEGKAAAIEPAPMATSQTQALTEESLKPEQSKAGDVAVSSTNIDTSSSSKKVIINQQPHSPVGF